MKNVRKWAGLLLCVLFVGCGVVDEAENATREVGKTATEARGLIQDLRGAIDSISSGVANTVKEPVSGLRVEDRAGLRIPSTAPGAAAIAVPRDGEVGQTTVDLDGNGDAEKVEFIAVTSDEIYFWGSFYDQEYDEDVCWAAFQTAETEYYYASPCDDDTDMLACEYSGANPDGECWFCTDGECELDTEEGACETDDCLEDDFCEGEECDDDCVDDDCF